MPPAFPIHIPAYIDVYDTYLEVRVVDQIFMVPREADASIDMMCHRIEGRARALAEGHIRINAVERERIRAFEDRHVEEHGLTTSFAMAHQFSGLGTSSEIRCTVCQQSEDITDIEDWG